MIRSPPNDTYPSEIGYVRPCLKTRPTNVMLTPNWLALVGSFIVDEHSSIVNNGSQLECVSRTKGILGPRTDERKHALNEHINKHEHKFSNVASFVIYELEYTDNTMQKNSRTKITASSLPLLSSYELRYLRSYRPLVSFQCNFGKKFYTNIFFPLP